MCLIGLRLAPGSDHPLRLAANRDEYFLRPTAAASWWHDVPGVFAGRDLLASGTWLGVARPSRARPGARVGRLVALTNFREPALESPRAGLASRGSIVTELLVAPESLEVALLRLAANASAYAGFSVLAFEWREDAGDRPLAIEGWSFGNRSDASPVRLPPGTHILANGPLNARWSKSEKLRAVFDEFEGHSGSPGAEPSDAGVALEDALRDCLMDAAPADPTGVGAAATSDENTAADRALSACFIRMPGRAYGTRSSAIVTLAADGMMEFDETTWSTDVSPRIEHRRRARISTLLQRAEDLAQQL